MFREKRNKNEEAGISPREQQKILQEIGDS